MNLLAPPDASPDTGIAHALARHGDAPALVGDGATVTYAELESRVSEVAATLGASRRLILLGASNTVETVAVYLAALRGRHPVLLASGSDERAQAALVDSYRPDVLALDGDLVEVRDRSTHDLHPDLALLLSTSGSTGASKLVRLSQRNLASNAAAIASYLSLSPEDRAITTLPMHYCYGLSVLNSHLHAGASVALTELSVVDACFWSLFERVGATGIAGVPHTFDLLDRIRFDAMHLPALRYVTQAGGRMDPEKVRRYANLGRERGWDLYVMYGQTEATARMAYLPPALATTYPEAVGVAVAGGAFSIVEADTRGVGELVYRGPNVMLGYAEGPDDLATGRCIDTLHTGDLGRRNDAGLIEIVGRAGRIIKQFGVRIDLDDLERLLGQHGVTALCTGDDSQLIVGLDDASDPSVVHTLIDDRLRLPVSRVSVVRFEELPRFTTGKPDYAAVRARAAAAAASEGAPSTAIVSPSSSDVHTAFADVLGVDVDGDDTFVSLGGDSLSYVEMSIRLEELVGTLPRDWHTQPVRELAAPRVRVPRRRWTDVETSVALRAAAIVLIVGTHSGLWHQPGGAHALLAIAGFNFARFQLRAHSMWASLARVAVPSMCWIGLVAAATGDYAWPNALLINGLGVGPEGEWGYWFLEALLQILLPLAALFSIPTLRRVEFRWPFVVASAAVAVGLVVRFDIIDLSTDHRIARPHEVFWLFALGWAAATATTWRHRLLVSIVGAVTVAGFFADAHREAIVVVAIAAIVWLPTVPLPRLAVRAVAGTAAASLFVYLTHFQVHPPVGRAFGPVAAVVVSLLAGGAAWLVAQRAIAAATAVVRDRHAARDRRGWRSSVTFPEAGGHASRRG